MGNKTVEGQVSCRSLRLDRVFQLQLSVAASAVFSGRKHLCQCSSSSTYNMRHWLPVLSYLRRCRVKLFGELSAQIWRQDGWVSAVISSLSMMHEVQLQLRECIPTSY